MKAHWFALPIVCLLLGACGLSQPASQPQPTPSAGSPVIANPCRVPDVVGQDQTAAEALVRGANLKPVANPQFNSGTPVGQIMNQSPPANELVECQQIVDIVVSLGSAVTATMPPTVTPISTDTPIPSARPTSTQSPQPTVTVPPTPRPAVPTLPPPTPTVFVGTEPQPDMFCSLPCGPFEPLSTIWYYSREQETAHQEWCRLSGGGECEGLPQEVYRQVTFEVTRCRAEYADTCTLNHVTCSSQCGLGPREQRRDCKARCDEEERFCYEDAPSQADCPR